jgi:hypothetical protein
MNVRFVLTLFIGLAFHLPSGAQRWYVGAQAGLTLSVISGTGIASLTKPGVVGGAYIGHRFHPRFSALSGLNFIMKGAARNGNPDAGDFNTFSIQLNYLEMPWVLRWHIDAKHRFTLDAGLTHSILLHESVTQDGGQIQGDRGFNPYELGLLIGGAYHFHPQWALHIQFRNSVTPIRPNISGQTLINPIWGQINIGQLNTVLSAGLSYRIWPKEKKDRFEDPPAPKPRKPRGRIYDE